jgi:hypothetical protein
VPPWVHLGSDVWSYTSLPGRSSSNGPCAMSRVAVSPVTLSPYHLSPVHHLLGTTRSRYVRGPFHDQCPRGFHTIIDFHVGTQYTCTWRKTRLPSRSSDNQQRRTTVSGILVDLRSSKRRTTTLNNIEKDIVNLRQQRKGTASIRRRLVASCCALTGRSFGNGSSQHQRSTNRRSL